MTLRGAIPQLDGEATTLPLAGALPPQNKRQKSTHRPPNGPLPADRPLQGTWSKTVRHPHVPVHQWVLSLPIPLRLLLAAQPKLVTPVLQVVHNVITRHLLGQVALKEAEVDSGAVKLIQRFGSAANLNIHLHCLVLDGVYRRIAEEAPEFVEAPAATDEALQSVLHKIITRIMKLLTRRGVLVKEEGSTYMADSDAYSDEARTLRPLQAAACTYRITFGPRAGQKVRKVQGAMFRKRGFKQMLLADIDGFNLHTAVRCAADERQALEQLCRYITRPALADERVQTNAAGQVVLKLKTGSRDGTTHLVMSPLEFMQRLAALVQARAGLPWSFREKSLRATASRRLTHGGECR